MAQGTRRLLSPILPGLVGVLILPALPTGAAGEDNSAGIIFSHKYHAYMQMDCSVCHAPADTSASATADDLLPRGHGVCAECHDVEKAESCGKCHVSGSAPAALGRITDYSPKFDHAAHVGQGIGCDRCHPGVAESDSSSADHLPPMEPCMVCHDGATADKSCIVCHEKPEGKLPENHKPTEWVADHVFAYSVDMGQSCKMCHTNQQCQRCHLDWVLLKP